MIHRFTGSKEMKDFIAAASNALDPDKQYMTQLNKYEKGKKEPGFIYQLAYMARAAGDDSITTVLGAVYLKTQTDLLTGKNAKFIFDFTGNTDGKYFELIKQNAAVFEKAVGKERFDSKMSNMVFEASWKQTGYKDDIPKDKAVDYINAARTYFKQQLPNQEDQLTHRYAINVFIALKDLDGFAKEIIAWYDKYPSQDANELNSIAWNFYENMTDPAHLQKALAWALESVKLSAGYGNTDTVAALYFKLGNKGKAKVYAEKAIALGKAEGQDVSATEKLLANINQ
jgi:hypothetical protein